MTQERATVNAAHPGVCVEVLVTCWWDAFYIPLEPLAGTEVSCNSLVNLTITFLLLLHLCKSTMVSRVFAKTGRSFDLHMGPAGLLHSWSLPRLVTWYILNIGLEGWGGGAATKTLFTV